MEALNKPIVGPVSYLREHKVYLEVAKNRTQKKEDKNSCSKRFVEREKGNQTFSLEYGIQSKYYTWKQASQPQCTSNTISLPLTSTLCSTPVPYNYTSFSVLVQLYFNASRPRWIMYLAAVSASKALSIFCASLVTGAFVIRYYADYIDRYCVQFLLENE